MVRRYSHAELSFDSVLSNRTFYGDRDALLLPRVVEFDIDLMLMYLNVFNVFKLK